jgi:hypothetical protein
MSETVFQFNGIDYPLSLPDETIGEEIEAHIVSQRANPVAAVTEVLDQIQEDRRQAWMDAAIASLCKPPAPVSPKELTQFFTTVEGAVWSFHMVVRRHTPSVTLDRAREIVHKMTQAELLELSAMCLKLAESSKADEPQE